MGGGLTRVGVEGLTLPVGEAFGGLFRHALPPHIALRRHRHIGEDGLRGEHVHGDGVGADTSARCDTKESRLGVDGAKAPVCSRCQPGDVITQGFDLPPGEGGLHHRKVCFAAGTGECRNHPVGLALRAGDFHQQHVLGHPAFFPREHGGDPQSEGFLGQQSVAAVGGAKRPDFFGLGEVGNVFGLIARPGGVALTVLERCSDGVEALHPGGALGNTGEHFGLNPDHHVQAQNHVGGVGDLNTESRHRGVERSHRERNDVEGATVHGALTQAPKRFAHGGRVFPVVGGSCILRIL